MARGPPRFRKNEANCSFAAHFRLGLAAQLRQPAQQANTAAFLAFSRAPGIVKRSGWMDNRQDLQNRFLNQLRRKRARVFVFLVNGIKLKGVIGGFDMFVILLQNGVSQIVYKHAISAIVPARQHDLEDILSGQEAATLD